MQQQQQIIKQGFIKVSSDHTHLCLEDGTPWHFCGANCYYLMTRAADPSTLPDVISVLDDLQAAGITVVRTWAFADGPQWNALQPSPGVFDEKVFCALDRVIAEAGSRGLRILFNLINFWSDYGGMPQYVEWSRQARGLPPLLSKKDEQSGTSAASIASEFYQDSWCQSTFLNFVKTVILRTNTITGVKYRDDPTILGFAPANEPQCLCDPGCRGSTLATWAHCTAAEIKKLDPNHLVFMNCEGFWGPAYQPKDAPENQQVPLILNKLENPDHCTCIQGTGGGGNPYDCSYNGCDFISDCGSPYIDVVCCHMYPDLWLPNASEETRLNFAVAWIDAHVDACAQILKKPLILSEFGKHKVENSTGVPDTRQIYFQTVLTRCIDHMKRGNPLAGSIFWTAAAESYPDYDGFTIYLPRKTSRSGYQEGDGVAEVIKEHAAAVKELNDRQGQVVVVGEGGGRGGSGGESRRREEEGEGSSAARLLSKTKGKLESKLAQLH